MITTINDINASIKLNNIIFNIKKIIIEENNYNYNGRLNHFTAQYATSKSIKILATTSNNNYIALGNWVNPIMQSGYVTNYKVDVNSNGVFIGGIFPIDYDFNQYIINVTFSADHIAGDFTLFKLKEVRKEKLKRLNEICQKS